MFGCFMRMTFSRAYANVHLEIEKTFTGSPRQGIDLVLVDVWRQESNEDSDESRDRAVEECKQLAIVSWTDPISSTAPVSQP
jgi:hypothetical protein